MSNSLRNWVFNISQNNTEILIDSDSQFIYKCITSSFLLILIRVSILWILLLIIFPRYYFLPIIFVIDIICKQIILFWIYYCLNYFPRMVSFFCQYFYYNIHYFWNHCRKPLKYFIDNIMCNLFQLLIAALN